MYFYCIVYTATHCNARYPLLDELFGSGLFANQLVRDARIMSSSYMVGHAPSDARMSRVGWCAENICEAESDDHNHYIQVDFGAELVVEAIAIDGVEDNGYVTEYYVEYGIDPNELYCVISEEFNGSVSIVSLII